MSTNDYRSTLNITLSDKDPGAFPQRGNLPTKEPERQKRWEEIGLYRKSLEKPCPKGKFLLHDGPPYSNGNIHLGHALNKISKDVIIRYRSLTGYYAPYVPGWDNHGMPIENAVSKDFREKKQTPDRVTLRRACRDYARQWIDIQREQFKRLGVRGDWDNPYLTMNHRFEAKIVEVFGELATKGYIYRGLKPVLWCATCETALADAEVEYDAHVSNSIYVRFPLWNDPNGVFALSDAATAKEGKREEGVPCYVIIWTTTPWTIPANLAVAAHPEAEYALLRAERGEETGYYLVAKPLAEAVMNAIKVTEYEIVKTLTGKELEGLVFQHPLFPRVSPVVFADYVTMDAGTGIVHTAPGHGKEDFDTGLRYGLEALNPVDSAGCYTAEAGSYNEVEFKGLRVTTTGHSKENSAANKALITALSQSGNLLKVTKIEHQYPHCWRCHSPLIFRATVQWFMSIDHNDLRQEALKAIRDVKWYPAESINRITSMVANRPDWCVSRQRSWGVGIPAFYCNACGGAILEARAIQSVVELVQRESSDAWYDHKAEAILPQGYTCPECGADASQLRKETDVLDVWFDSGSTNRAVLEDRETWHDLEWPADLYLEGGDQHRGWFNSSLMIAVATKGAAPYCSVVTNGWTLDEQGRAMHKSLGNVVSPLEITEKYGADVLRWWVASTNFMEDVGCGDNVIKQVAESYRRIRNTFRFLLNNLYDFDPAQDAVPEAEMQELDRWILNALRQVVEKATDGYEKHEFHSVYTSVHNFCAVELSAFYLDVIKDRLYASRADSTERRSAQTALHQIADVLARLLAPVLVHTTDEAWEYLKTPNKAESVHLADFPEEKADSEKFVNWTTILHIRDEVKKALEEARQANQIGNPLEACVEINANTSTFGILVGFGASLLSTLFLVSQVVLHESESTGGRSFDLDLRVRSADGVKCARCWLIRQDVGTVEAHPTLCVRCADAIS